MRKTVLMVAAALVIGAGIGYWGGLGISGDQTSMPGTSGEKEVLYWVAPMDPNFRRDKPGKSPMGMDLIPKYADDGTGGAEGEAIRIEAAVANNIGVRTAEATVTDLSREINTVGYVAIDEGKTSHVHVRAAGWVDKLYRKAVGEHVNKGEVIFEIYSPDLVAAQAEYKQALGFTNDALQTASLDRLIALGMAEAQIEDLRKTGQIKNLVDVRAPQDGIIMALQIGEGMYVTPGKTVFSFADLSTVWVKVEVFEAQSSWVAAGQQATLTLPFLPGETWTGTVDYVYPVIDPKSRTLEVRLSFPNADHRLKPNMYGEIGLFVEPARDVVSIPREALIRTGKTDRVIVALGDGLFRPAEVTAGMETSERVEIKAGLAAGERVVTSGQFLIDSEASLNGAFLRMLPDSSDMAGMGEGDAAQNEDTAVGAPESHHGIGTLVSFNDDGTVTLSHEPIETLNWPAMTMGFNVSTVVDLSEFKIDDQLKFTIKRSPDGPFVITTATKM